MWKSPTRISYKYKRAPQPFIVRRMTAILLLKGSYSMQLILIILLILLLIGALPTWPYSSGWGYYPSGGLGLVLLIVLIVLLLGGRG
jgi:hypothetical protein